MNIASIYARKFAAGDFRSVEEAIEAAIAASVLTVVPAPHSRNLTPKTKELLDTIKAYQAEHGYCPSYQEMADAVGVASKSGIHRMIIELEERGHISRLPHHSRSIALNGVAA